MLEFPRAFRNHEINSVEVRRFTMCVVVHDRFDFELTNLGFGFIFGMKILVLHSAFMVIGVKHADLDSDDDVGMCHDRDVNNTAKPWHLKIS